MPRINLLAVVLLGLLLIIAQRGVSSADEFKTIDNSSPQEVVDGMTNKAGRGIANVTTGWLELPKQVYTTSKEDGIAKGILLGPFKGIGMTIVRTVTGIGELATFFLSTPGFYDSYVEPDYVWQEE